MHISIPHIVIGSIFLVRSLHFIFVSLFFLDHFHVSYARGSSVYAGDVPEHRKAILQGEFVIQRLDLTRHERFYHFSLIPEQLSMSSTMSITYGVYGEIGGIMDIEDIIDIRALVIWCGLIEGYLGKWHKFTT